MKQQQIIQAFKSLDFEALNNLLDDDKSYMEVPKSVFLSELKENVQGYEIDSFKEVIEDTHNGYKAYKFYDGPYKPSLNLCFEEKNGKITDIYLYSDLNDKYDFSFDYTFYEDEKVNFIPTIEYLINVQRVEKAVEEFEKLELIGLVPAQEVAYWYGKYEYLADELKLKNTSRIKYKAYKRLALLYRDVYNVAQGYKKNHLAKQDLIEYYKINAGDERMIVKWLLDYKGSLCSLKKTENWKKTGILILETEITDLVVDCSDCLESFIVEEIYFVHHDEIMKKYEPTDEHFKQNKEGILVTLESYLKLHNKYLDLL